jgi:riboflavin kinase/FMN adenylyltransferase
VYAGTAYIAGQPFAAAIHIGPNPTFHDDRRRLEAHLIGWQGDLYGQTLEVEFREQLRGVQKFGSVEELRHQLQADVAAAARLFGGSA